MENKSLIGKKFRYKSKYGGLSDWKGIIISIHDGMINIVGKGEIVKTLETIKGTIGVYNTCNMEESSKYIKSENGIPYFLDEIEIID